jgi:hypothetical protein
LFVEAKKSKRDENISGTPSDVRKAFLLRLPAHWAHDHTEIWRNFDAGEII